MALYILVTHRQTTNVSEVKFHVNIRIIIYKLSKHPVLKLERSPVS